ncbi:uncharacterized protein LOC135710196 [Ochlerotatus camptorhynchus]|uniref:uncharacterized protein LOC135710196 n=1 Tax=Ochlerotatus camptorhynchus TaxID=644619 RepID=UPI0031D8336F
MILSRRCPTTLLVSFGCSMLFLLLQTLVTVQSHALPETVERKFETDGGLNLVEAPALALQQPSDSETAPQLSASSRSQPRARQLDLDRMDSLSQPSASEIIRSKRWKLQKITPPGRSRINNRSMTAFNEMDSGEYSDDQNLEQQHQYHHQPATRHWSTALQVHRSLDTANDEDDQEESRMIEEARFKKKKKKKEEDEYLLEALLVDELSASLEDDDDIDANPEARFKKKKKYHLKHKYKKFLLPLLLAYKLKFMMLFPAIIGGLALLVKAAGLAGFFFALFASVVSLQKSH